MRCLCNEQSVAEFYRYLAHYLVWEPDHQLRRFISNTRSAWVTAFQGQSPVNSRLPVSSILRISFFKTSTVKTTAIFSWTFWYICYWYWPARYNLIEKIQRDPTLWNTMHTHNIHIMCFSKFVQLWSQIFAAFFCFYYFAILSLDVGVMYNC